MFWHSAGFQSIAYMGGHDKSARQRVTLSVGVCSGMTSASPPASLRVADNRDRVPIIHRVEIAEKMTLPLLFTARNRRPPVGGTVAVSTAPGFGVILRITASVFVAVIFVVAVDQCIQARGVLLAAHCAASPMVISSAI